MNNIMVGESDLEQIQRISNQRATALDRAHRKIEKLEKRIKELEMFREMERAVAASRNARPPYDWMKTDKL